jgi:hypothetical protein
MSSFMRWSSLETYLAQTSRQYRAELFRRAECLTRHARLNSDLGPSEFTWEADLRTDLFGRLREDPRLAM